MDPELIKRWMAPDAYEVTRVEVDERIGGRYQVWHENSGVSAGRFECEILELTPDRRIVWRWGFAGPDASGEPIYDTVLSITLHETSDGKTKLDLVHEQLGDLAAALPEVAGQVEAGWNDVLSKLNTELSAAPREPVFTQTMQIGIVVRDLEMTMRNYVDNFGIGPWQVHQFKADDVKLWLENGKPAKPSTRIATAMVGQVQWELIEPLDDKSIFAQFLAEKGEGVHHLAVATTDFDATLAAEAKRGNELVLDCELNGDFSGIKVAYLGTQRELGVTLEVFSGLPAA